MVVGDFHIVGVLALPAEHDAPLVVDSDGMQAFHVTAQGLQAVPRRSAEVFKSFCFMDGDKLVIRPLLDLPRNLTGNNQTENLPGFLISEVANHTRTLRWLAWSASKSSQIRVFSALSVYEMFSLRNVTRV
jgi:hypothetical protein